MKSKKSQSRHEPSPGLTEKQVERVAEIFRALAEPTRLRILRLLHDGPMAVGQLVDAMEARQANVSKQLGVLHGAGLVDRRREGMTVLYQISEPMIFELCALVCRKIHRDAERDASDFA
ncbi:MAG: winged helix-turn-helix transcriptional regulator [Phycisphaeraceae bacterium]|nr:winged helix-turn-helix transcriptional regulator [Phycisphaeraceae bacterium]